MNRLFKDKFVSHLISYKYLNFSLIQKLKKSFFITLMCKIKKC